MRRYGRTGVVAGIFLLLTTVSASATTKVIDGFEKKAGAAVQHEPQWCWAASIQAVLASYGINRSQEQIVQETYGKVENLPVYSPNQLYETLNNRRARPDGTEEVVTGKFFTGIPTSRFLIDEIEGGHPVILWYTNGLFGHSIVVYGVDYQQINGKSVVTSVRVFDPYPGQSNFKSIASENLAPTVQHYFAIRGVMVKKGEQLAAADQPKQLADQPAPQADAPPVNQPGNDPQNAQPDFNPQEVEPGNNVPMPENPMANLPNMNNPGIDPNANIPEVQMPQVPDWNAQANLQDGPDAQQLNQLMAQLGQEYQARQAVINQMMAQMQMQYMENQRQMAAMLSQMQQNAGMWQNGNPYMQMHMNNYMPQQCPPCYPNMQWPGMNNGW